MNDIEQIKKNIELQNEPLFREKWHKKNQARQEFFDKQKKTAERLKKDLLAAQMLYDNGLSIFDESQANKNFRDLLKLDEITEIAALYSAKENGRTVQKLESIRKENFYNAFHMPIWEKLTVAEKVKSLEWMFETINEKYNTGLKHLTYVPYFGDEEDFASLYGYYYFPVEDEEYVKPFLFVNINGIQDMGPSQYILTVGHELMHARQKKYLDNLREEGIDFYSLSLSNEYFDDYFSDEYIKLDRATKFALYKVCQTEKTADLQGLKCLIKYMKYNLEKYGPNTSNKEELENAVSYTLFDYGGKSKFSKKFNTSEGIVANEEIVLKGQSINLIKLYTLIKYMQHDLEEATVNEELLESQIQELEEELSTGEISEEEADQKIKDCKEEMAGYRQEKKLCKFQIKITKAAFMDTLKNGKLPEYFPKDSFDALGLKDDRVVDLPKWLKHNKLSSLDEMEFILEEANELK